MSCPDCGAESRQTYDCGHTATMTTPAEAAGWECGWCGGYYDDGDAYRDYACDEQRQEELDDEI